MSTTSKALFRILLELKEAIRRGKSISGLNLLVYVSYVGNTVQSLFQQATDQRHKASRVGNRSHEHFKLKVDDT